MRKPQFGLVTGLLTIFFILVLIRINFEKYIPQLPPNKLANMPGAFLRVAVHEPIDWQPSPSDAFVRAAILNRPILFVVGSRCSQVGALMDSRVFSNWSVATEINNAFVPVRVDLNEHPEWGNTVFPISRLQIPFLDDFQVFTLSRDAKLERVFDAPTQFSQIDPNAFIDLLTASRRDFDENEAPQHSSPYRQVQKQDADELASGSTRQVPGFQEFADALKNAISPSTGAFVENGFLRMRPAAWTYLARVNRRATLVTSLDRFLLSPSMDVLRGGFFDIDESHEELNIGFSEKTVDNAAMAATLAESGATFHDAFYTIAAHRTFDMIMRDLTQGQLLVSCRMSDEDLSSGKSASSSFSPEALSHLMPTSAEATWASENLNPGKNRQQILFISNRTAIASLDLETVCRTLRKTTPLPPVAYQEVYLDVNGNALANLCRCARIWGDQDRIKQIRNCVGDLESFTTGLEISHTPQPAEAGTILGDYLAFADIQLQFFLATGESSHFSEGRQILIRAMKSFLNRRGGLDTFGPNYPESVPVDFNNPQVVDTGMESTTAQAIRLCFAYGRLLGQTRDGHYLVKLASDQVAKYASFSDGASPSLGGYYLSATELADPTCAFAVGPKAVDQANALSGLRPSRLIAPATQSIRPDLNDRSPGIYIVSGSQTTGPFSVEKAANLIPKFSQVGVVPEG